MQKVIIGLSGGVDSSVAAFLLKKEYEVIGVTFTFHSETEDGKSHIDELDAAKVAKHLGIKHVILDYSKIFEEEVIGNFVSEYCCARTPNPCIRCNRYVKFRALLDYADSIGADYIATGHYAKVVCTDMGRYSIACADSSKDQAYALYMLTQEQLSRTLMPLGTYDKEETRRIAHDEKIPVADKKDSQDICFVPDGNYAAFLEKHQGKQIGVPGDFIDMNGNVIGKHKGLIYYTVGQRKGLGIAAGKPVYVCGIDSEANRVIIGDNEDLFSKELYITDIKYMGLHPGTSQFDALAKIRYAHKGSMAHVTLLNNNCARVEFDEPQRAATPGQSVVFYDTSDGVSVVLGGGIIMVNSYDM